MSVDIIRTERGWPGHFICAERCMFRRNTLIEQGELRIVVSTVGNYRPEEAVTKILGEDGPPYEIGWNRFYETMAFHAVWDGNYWEADVTRQVPFESEWSIDAKSPKQLLRDVDARADRMHEDVVDEIGHRMANGDRFEPAS